MRKKRQRVTVGIVLAMTLLFLIPVLGGDVPMSVHVAWQMTEIILLATLHALWHGYNKN